MRIVIATVAIALVAVAALSVGVDLDDPSSRGCERRRGAADAQPAPARMAAPEETSAAEVAVDSPAVVAPPQPRAGIDTGPLVGDVSTSSARIWVRSDAGAALRVRWWFADPASDLADQRADGSVDAATGSFVTEYVRPGPETDHTHVFVLGGLRPEARVEYAVESDAGGVAGGSFRTPRPEDQGGRLLIAFGSCTEFDEEPIFEAIGAVDSDLLLMIGDNNYANTGELDRLRAVYRRFRAIPPRAAVVANTPTLAIWDDHDFLGNDTNGLTPGREVALRVFRENWANPAYGTNDTPGVFFSARRGDVEIFMLDGRYHRGVGGSFLGAGQTEWLLGALTASDAVFKLVVLGSRWTLNDRSDSWVQFAAERDALFRAWGQAGIEGIVLLSGDSHSVEFRELPVADRVGYNLPELVSSTLASHPQRCEPDTSSEPDLRECFTGQHYFVTLAIDTTLDDPTLVATVRDVAGAAVHSWTIARSDLQARGVQPSGPPGSALPPL